MMPTRLNRYPARWLVVSGAMLFLLLAFAARAEAAQIDNEACLACHSNPGLSVELPSGETLPASIDPEVYQSSVHGQADMECVACHTDIEGYPHDPITAETLRAYEVERYAVCETCHANQYTETLDSIHGQQLAAGNLNAPVCSDCHGAHDVSDPQVPRRQMSQVCQQCHSEIYGQYATSVHGASLAEANNPDVPTCTDCHGVHSQEDPRTAEFRLRSPELCAECHANEGLMAPYGITTDVFDTYVADFHGTTVRLFDRESPDQPVNTAVCTDCHGVHNIERVTAATANVAKHNLLDTCRRCHPTANANFPDSWVGHFPASPDRFPLVYYVNLFYQIFVPTVIGGMLLFVLLDLGRRIYDRTKRKGA